MIVGNRKSLEEILQMVKPYKKILLLGCRECITVCAAGGEREVGVLASELKMSRAKDGQEIEIKEFTLERQCDFEYIDQIKPFVDEYEAIVSMACGAGIQYTAETISEKDRASCNQHDFPRRDAGAGSVERTVPGMRRVHPAPDRRRLPGRPLRQEPVQRSLRRILERQVRSEQGNGLRLAVDRGPLERARSAGQVRRNHPGKGLVDIAETADPARELEKI